MSYVDPDDTSYKTFQDLLNGYRLTEALTVAHTSGIFDRIESGGTSGDVLCRHAGWDQSNGHRFLQALCSLGLLRNDNGLYVLSRFSQTFLVKTSEDYQGNKLKFEERLLDSWHHLGETLTRGERVYGATSKNNEDYDRALGDYLGAMDDAARIRASEVWKRISPGEKGIILDAGAGSGAFLAAFLNRHQGWQGVFCDLKDVITKAKKSETIRLIADRLIFIETNLLESEIKPNRKVDILLMSNLLHCQGSNETQTVLMNSLNTVSGDGVVLIHDFFTDCGWRGGMYDLHMMLNTYNGRTYTNDELISLMKEHGFDYSRTIQLDSGSTLLATSRNPLQNDFFL